ncbi:MAG: pirin family protein [Deltaproteobacteria bacterium]|nr:pirin family protein [Deltaproteobacteria bacterium]
MSRSPIRRVKPLGFPWETPDPFLFCVHHDDRYPAGNELMGPAVSLAGRNLGQDFEVKDGFRMYHGRVVPGFPQHPHRGFETVTVVRRGLIDHSDSMGAAARYGGGDVQWLTAGQGIQHAEMFPLLDRERGNHLELFQIWLNLPKADKMADPHFTMFWNHEVPRAVPTHSEGVEVTLVAGKLENHGPPAPPPKSWASRPDADVAIWIVRLAPGAKWTMPAAATGSNRILYFFAGHGLRVAGQVIPDQHLVDVHADAALALEAGPSVTELLVLQGRPIAEPVAQYGPFVMNTRAEIQQAFADYQRTQFGGWPWPSEAPVHGREEGRFARHANGRIERPALKTKRG